MARTPDTSLAQFAWGHVYSWVGVTGWGRYAKHEIVHGARFVRMETTNDDASVTLVDYSKLDQWTRDEAPTKVKRRALRRSASDRHVGSERMSLRGGRERSVRESTAGAIGHAMSGSGRRGRWLGGGACDKAGAGGDLCGLDPIRRKSAIV